MTSKPISPLRQRMINDMSVRNFVPDTQREYIRAVKNLTIFLKRSPDTATAEDLRAFQLHMTETGVRPPTINATVTALRFVNTQPFLVAVNSDAAPSSGDPFRVARMASRTPMARRRAVSMTDRMSA